MSFALELATRINRLADGPLPEEAFQIAKGSLLDTLGVALAGAQEPAARIPARVLDIGSQSGPCVIYGSQERASALDAALVNGAAAHALDFDDCSTTMGGHPSVPVLPALIALGEEIEADGASLLRAYIAGIETETRLARGLLPCHYEKGWHPTATLGVFGAAAACGRMLKLDAEALARALAIAVSLSSGVKANFGTAAKPLHAGLAARNGLYAARLAQSGFSASADAFEQVQGFFNLFNGEGLYDADAILADWGGTLETLEPGIAIKQHPCCGSAHSAIDAALKLRQAHGPFALDDIAAIETETHARRLAHTNRTELKNGLDAKFSVQYLTCRALADGQIRLAHFENGAYAEAAILDLMSRCTARAHSNGDQYLGTVIVTLRNGQVFTAQASTPFGRGPGNPMSQEELTEKFLDCSSRALERHKAESLAESIWRMEQTKNIRDVTTMLASGPLQ
ncbi:MmgE/PrpD family protein [Bosea sp. 2KB_26]|uniref:MmgE/PrpD family protein n=1 Tax=Bosea sp. 2KB_26 TaxID=3237475 RepID=UPI003F90C1F4